MEAETKAVGKGSGSAVVSGERSGSGGGLDSWIGVGGEVDVGFGIGVEVGDGDSVGAGAGFELGTNASDGSISSMMGTRVNQGSGKTGITPVTLGWFSRG